jgi:hypothetical protein
MTEYINKCRTCNNQLLDGIYFCSENCRQIYWKSAPNNPLNKKTISIAEIQQKLKLKAKLIRDKAAQNKSNLSEEA